MVDDTACACPPPGSVTLCITLGLTAEVLLAETGVWHVRCLWGCSKVFNVIHCSGIVCNVAGVLLTIGSVTAGIEVTEGCVTSSAMLTGPAADALFDDVAALLLLLSGLSMPHLARMLLIFCTSFCVASCNQAAVSQVEGMPSKMAKAP